MQTIQYGLHHSRDSFSLTECVRSIDYSTADLEEAKQRVYRDSLRRGWNDGVLNESERQFLRWLATKIALTSEVSRQLELEQAREWFGSTLAAAMSDGILDQAEEARLEAIARAVGMTLPQFARAFYQYEGEAFLRSIFLACVADNHISQSDWDYLLHVTRKLGVEHHEMLAAIQPQAQQFVEHILADAKSDGAITPHEEATLQWLIQNLGLNEHFRQYVATEIGTLKSLSAIEAGRLPSILPPGGIEHRSGEIIHWWGHATWREHRARKSGMHAHDHLGLLVLADSRLVFSADTKSQSINYRKIVAHRGTSNWIELQAEGKPVSQLFFEPSPLPYAILRSAVAMANQTKLAKLEGGNSRHIPRDVRQRVWQRYGGRCAECSATNYLEYDHIIPVAKGGSNSDANVQLLCRGCNLKKSDLI